MSRDQHIDQSVTSIQSLLNTNGATFLMTSRVRSALGTLVINLLPCQTNKPKHSERRQIKKQIVHFFELSLYLNLEPLEVLLFCNFQINFLLWIYVFSLLHAPAHSRNVSILHRLHRCTIRITINALK